MSNLIKLILFLTLMTSLVNCGGFKKVDTRNTPVNAQERARKNVDEGRGTSINKIMKNRKGGNTSYEFSTSNPLWRASLETLDFLGINFGSKLIRRGFESFRTIPKVSGDCFDVGRPILSSVACI